MYRHGHLHTHIHTNTNIHINKYTYLASLLDNPRNVPTSLQRQSPILNAMVPGHLSLPPSFLGTIPYVLL